MTRALATLRQLAAALILTTIGVPAVLELASHGAGPERVEIHLENATQRHHADHCLSSMAPSERSTPTAAVPSLIVHHLAQTDSRAACIGLIGHEPRQTTHSRAPPNLIA